MSSERQLRYRSTEKGRIAARRAQSKYRQSEKGKARTKRYRTSEKGKATRKLYLLRRRRQPVSAERHA